MHEADLTGCDLTGATMDNCSLAGTTFERTVLEKADLRHSTGFVIDPDSNKVKKAKFSLSELPGLLLKYDIIVD